MLLQSGTLATGEQRRGEKGLVKGKCVPRETQRELARNTPPGGKSILAWGQPKGKHESKRLTVNVVKPTRKKLSTAGLQRFAGEETKEGREQLCPRKRNHSTKERAERPDSLRRAESHRAARKGRVRRCARTRRKKVGPTQFVWASLTAPPNLPEKSGGATITGGGSRSVEKQLLLDPSRSCRQLLDRSWNQEESQTLWSLELDQA